MCALGPGVRTCALPIWDHRDIGLIEVEAAGRGQAPAGRPAMDSNGAQPQILCRCRIDADARLSSCLIGVFGDELHVHERRLAGLVEMLRRHHWDIPVKYLAILGCHRRRVLALLPGQMGDAIDRSASVERTCCGTDAVPDQRWKFECHWSWLTKRFGYRQS